LRRGNHISVDVTATVKGETHRVRSREDETGRSVPSSVATRQVGIP
jgi:hypothetical protein